MMDMRWATPGHEPAKPRAVITFARIGVGIFFVLAAALLIGKRARKLRGTPRPAAHSRGSRALRVHAASAAQGHFYRATLPLSQGYFDIGVFKVKAHIDPIGEPPQDMTFNVNSKCELIPAGAAGAAGATAKLPGCSLYKGTIVISMATAALACLCVLIAASGFALQRHVKYSQVVNVFAVLLCELATASPPSRPSSAHSRSLSRLSRRQSFSARSPRA
jgi:hypothetical protein